MSILKNIEEEIKKNQSKSNKVTFDRIPYNTPVISVITDVYERDGKIYVVFTIVVSANTVIKKNRVYCGKYGLELLSGLLDTAGIDDVNDLVGIPAYVELAKNGDFTNVDVVQFLEKEEFNEVIAELEKSDNDFVNVLDDETEALPFN